MFQEFTRPDSPIPRQVHVPDLIRVRDLYLRAVRHMGGEKMTMGSRGAEDEASDSPVPLQVEAPESSIPVPEKWKRKLPKPSSSKPKKSKGSSSTTHSARVVEEATVSPSVAPEQVAPNLSDFGAMLDPIGEEVEETEIPLTSRRRKPVDPPAAEESEALAMVVAGVLSDPGMDEVVESRPDADAETGDAQSFAFDTQADEEPHAEVQVEQPAEATQMEVESEVAPAPAEEEIVDLASPPRDQIIAAPPESSFQTPPVTQSSPWGDITVLRALCHECSSISDGHLALLQRPSLFRGSSQYSPGANLFLRPRLREGGGYF